MSKLPADDKSSEKEEKYDKIKKIVDSDKNQTESSSDKEEKKPKKKCKPKISETEAEKSDSGKKTITNGIIIDGALEAAKDIMSFLYSI